jgi:hypothetical protein
MPPRFAYWTILIDDKPTAFRARDRQDLVPTLVQLQRTNQNVVMKWFAQGRLWESPDAQRESWLKRKAKVAERRGRDWRPGGEHRDPRARFDREEQRKKRRDDRAARAGSVARNEASRAVGETRRRDRPWKDRPPRGGKPQSRQHSHGGHERDRKWSRKPPSDRKPWQSKPAGGPPRRDKRFPHNRPPDVHSGGGGWRPRKRRKDEPPDGES